MSLVAESVAAARSQIRIKPQAGPQAQFASSKADICIYGGAAYGGKSFALVRGMIEHRGDQLIWPNYIEGQETPQSDRQRKAESRERRRTTARETEVTKREPKSRTVTEGHESGQKVTSGHVASRAVTPSLPVPIPSRAKTPPYPPHEPGQERDRGVGSIDPGSGNGHGPEPTPDVATLGRVLELWCERFGQDRVEGEHDEGSLADDLDARIAEEPRLGEWMHLCDQVARQPFLAIGIGRDLGPVTLAWLVRDRDRIHRAKHMRYANERRAARA